MAGAHQWTFPVVLRMSREVRKHEKSSETVIITFPTLLDSPYRLANSIELARYNGQLKEFSLHDMLVAAKRRLIELLNERLEYSAPTLATMRPQGHMEYMSRHPLTYKEGDRVTLYKERITVTLDELDFGRYPSDNVTINKDYLADTLIDEILDDKLVAAHWKVERFPDVGIKLFREHLEVSLMNGEVFVGVMLPDTQKCELVFTFWDAVRLYSSLQRRRFRVYRQYRKESANNEARSVFYMRSVLDAEKGDES